MFVTGAALAAVAFTGLVFGMNRLLSPSDPNTAKLEPYECGMPQQGQANVRVRLRFITIAVAFVIFDAESVLLFAVASRLRGSIAALGVIGIFTALLAFGLVYAWRKGALQWHL